LFKSVIKSLEKGKIMAKVPRWKESDIVNGYGEVKIVRWKYFMDYVHQEMLDYQTYIWRGHRRDNWILEPTIDRLIKEKNIPLSKAHQFRNAHLDRFKYAARGRRGLNPPKIESENDWWALGQHYGLATPLLDWTASPFVAAYFAFIDSSHEQTNHRAIYALHRPSVEEKVKEILKAEKENFEQKKREAETKRNSKPGMIDLAAMYFGGKPSQNPQVEFIRPMSDENYRLVNQGGLFTRAPNGMDLEAWTKKNFFGAKGYNLMKILIPNKDREACLKTLNRMNINHLTLFPDLYGASKFCNLFADIEKY
jgi:hypothetical protein